MFCFKFVWWSLSRSWFVPSHWQGALKWVFLLLKCKSKTLLSISKIWMYFQSELYSEMLIGATRDPQLRWIHSFKVFSYCSNLYKCISIQIVYPVLILKFVTNIWIGSEPLRKFKVLSGIVKKRVVDFISIICQRFSHWPLKRQTKCKYY